MQTEIEAIFTTVPVIADEGILELIPQRSPVVMVDRFYGMKEDCTYTGLLVKESDLFCRNGKLDECGVMEHIAQSAAARIGYICKEHQIPVPIGFIGSVDKMRIHALPEVGEQLYTIIKVEQEIFDITLVSATVRTADACIAEGQMKISLKRDV